MKKKLLSIVLAAVMVLSVCACGNEAQNAGNSELTETGETTANDETAGEGVVDNTSKYPIVNEPITIKGAVIGTGLEGTSRGVWDVASEISGINIEWEIIDSAALATYLAGGDWPDFFAGDISASLVNDYGVIGGRFVNYLDHLDIMPNLAQCYADYPVTLAASTRVNGEVYNLFKVNGPASTAVSIKAHVRLDVLEEAGFDHMAATTDELYEQLVALKEYYGEPNLILGTADSAGYNGAIFSAFGTLTDMNFGDDGTGKVVFARTTDQMKHYYEFLNKLYDEELMNREWLTMDNTLKTELDKSGKVAYVPNGNTLTAEDLKNGDWSYLTALAPMTSEYDDTRTYRQYLDYAAWCGMYINAESEYVEEICKLFDMMYATEEIVEGSGLYGHSWVYGLENEHWTISEDGKTYEQIVPEDFASFSAFQKSWMWANAGRADKFGSAVTSTPGNAQARQLGYVENVIPYMEGVVYFPETNMVFTEDEQYVLDNKLADLKAYYKQMEAEFITGAADIEKDWDKYVKTCEEMGLEDVLKVYQTAYDRWNAALVALK